MSLQIRLIQGSQAATEFVLDRQKRFFRVGRSTDCELVLSQLGLPDVACFIECNFAQKTAAIHCLCPEMLVLNDKILKLNEQVQWRVGQDLRIGPNCRLFLEEINTEDSGSGLMAPRRKVSEIPPTVTTRDVDLGFETTTIRQGDSVRRSGPRLQPRQKKAEPVEPSSMPVTPDHNESVAGEIAKKRSQMLQIAMIIVCAIVVVLMLIFADHDQKFRGGNGKVTIGILLDLIDKEIETNQRNKNLLKQIRDRIITTLSMPSESAKQYHEIIVTVQPLVESNQFPNQELGQLILKYVEQQQLTKPN